MSRLLSPAVTLLNRLRYPQKFALIFLLLILPLALAIGLLISETVPRLDVTTQEIAGVRTIRQLGDLFDLVHTSHTAAHQGDTRRIAELQATITVQADMIVRDAHAATLFTGADSLSRLKQNQIQLRDALVLGDAAMIDREHLELLATIRDEIRRIGDTSNLILDPELATYYLMDLVVLQTPERIELLAEAGHLIELATTEPNSVPAGELPALKGQLEANIASTHKGMLTAFSADPSLGATLSDDLDACLLKTSTLVKALSGLGAPGEVTPEQGAELNAQSYDLSMQLWRGALDALELRLEQRVAQFERKNTIAVWSAAAILISVAYLLLAFYRSVMQAVATLDEASRRMHTGGGGEVRLATRDELGQVVTSFNRVAAALAQENAERQTAEAERARLQEEMIQAQRATLEELSSPLIPLSDRIVLLPLIGTIDSRRAEQILRTLLHGVAARHAELVIVDMSGVRVVDTYVARAIVDATTGVRLLGARVALAGLRADVAQTLARIGVSFEMVIFYASLQEALEAALGPGRASRMGNPETDAV